MRFLLFPAMYGMWIKPIFPHFSCEETPLAISRISLVKNEDEPPESYTTGVLFRKKHDPPKIHNWVEVLLFA